MRLTTRGAGPLQASDSQPGSVAGRVAICGTELTNQNASRCPTPPRILYQPLSHRGIVTLRMINTLTYLVISFLYQLDIVVV